MSKLTTICIIFLLALTAACTNKSTLPPPNVVWLVSEDNSPYIGVYGDTLAKTPNIDQLAEGGVVYKHAFANAPVCAPARSTIITGMYANSMGTHQMRSKYQLPDFVEFFPQYLRDAGYYTTNCKKEDYNTSENLEPWNESSREATYKNRKPGQPFFHVQNYGTTHESSLFDSIADEELGYNPDDMVVYPYHPNTPDFRHDYAQYYYRIHQLDNQIGDFLDDLKAQGLYDSTIVFYYGDHGGVLPRGKRYLWESGTRVPMIVHVPEMYKELMPDELGSFSERIVSFVDLAPTVLNAVGIDIPEYMQGQPFLGEDVPKSKDYAFMFRGRMDERTDLMHAARNRQYRYIRNYYPERVYAQQLYYLWRSRAIRDWERRYKAGELNEVQSAYWETKPYEELYDVVKDPHNINNLATDPAYTDVLNELSDATDQWIKETKPLDVLPEPLMQRINQHGDIYSQVKSGDFPLLEVHQAAKMSARSAKKDFEKLFALSLNANPAIAFWGIKAMSKYHDQLKSFNKLEEFSKNLQRDEIYLRLHTANVLLDLGVSDKFQNLVSEALDSEFEFDRLEALLLYERLEASEAIDQKIIELYKNNEPNGWGYDVRTAVKLME